VLTLECASTNGRDLPLLGRHRTDKKIAIGVVNHSTAAVEPPDVVAGLIRKALEYVPPERLILSTDCGFGRRPRAASRSQERGDQSGANTRRELKLPEVEILPPIRASPRGLTNSFPSPLGEAG
jgi:5-methyltetrahydropteroyltriglutamate--homocysteine methyltransferase